MKIINDWSPIYTIILQYLGPWPALSLNVMSSRFSADSIDAPSSSTNTAKNSQQTAKMMNGQSNFNSMSSKMETQALMDNQHQGIRHGTPDANNTASFMSSDFNNNQQLEQHLNKTSHTAAIGPRAEDLFSQLHEALALEPKYQPNLFLPLQSNVSFAFALKVLRLSRPRCLYLCFLYLIEFFSSLHSGWWNHNWNQRRSSPCVALFKSLVRFTHWRPLHSNQSRWPILDKDESSSETHERHFGWIYLFVYKATGPPSHRSRRLSCHLSSE